MSGYSVIGDEIRLHFDDFGQESYQLFLKAKKLPEQRVEFHKDTETYSIYAPARFALMIGAEVPDVCRPPLSLAEFLFDDQKTIVTQSLAAKRYAVWSQCGNGKTLIGLEYARQVQHKRGGRVLIVTRNEIVPQWLSEAKTFYGDTLKLTRLRSRAEMKEWCANGESGIAITNYEKFNPESLDEQVVNECRNLAGIVLDESSRLKGGGGKQKWALIKSCKGIEYKLSLTATPAPNDTIEFASQASFLEKMRSDNDIIWTYFVRDRKSHRWTVKPHAREGFYRFMSCWSIYVNDPKRYGWRLGQPDIPKPTYHIIDVAPTPEQLERLRVVTADIKTGQMDLLGGSLTNAIQRNKLSQLAKGFLYRKKTGAAPERIPSRKPAVVNEIVRREAARGAQVLVWTVYDEESVILAELLEGLPDLEVLTGKTKASDRVKMIERFRTGATRVLVSRARMLGYGMNFQCCNAMVFSGFTDSFEDQYQTVRRAVRHGQTESVQIYFPVIRELEGDTLDNIQRKEAEFEAAIAVMENNYIAAKRELEGKV